MSRFNENESKQEILKGRQPARGSLYSDKMQSNRGNNNRGNRGFHGHRGGQQLKNDF
jgi:hypothetical protein